MIYNFHGIKKNKLCKIINIQGVPIMGFQFEVKNTKVDYKY